MVLPNLSFTSMKQQTAVNSSQNLVFTPAISVMTGSPDSQAPSSFNVPTSQIPNINQTQTTPTSLTFTPVPSALAGFPAGDIMGQLPGNSGTSKDSFKEASIFNENTIIIMMVVGAVAFLFFGKK